MGEKEKLKEKLRNKYNELKTEIKNIKDEDFKNFDIDFENIIKLIDEEKMELSEISTLNEKDQKRFVNFYSKEICKKESFIKKCLTKAKNNFQETLKEFKENDIKI